MTDPEVSQSVEDSKSNFSEVRKEANVDSDIYEEQLLFPDMELSSADSNGLDMVSGEVPPLIEAELKKMDFIETIPPVEISDESLRAEENESDSQKQKFTETLVDDLLLQDLKKIPQRMAFKIGDVADMLGVKQYVLRYWESEFDVLKPKKAANNQRMYTRKDVENAFLIRKLLYRDRFSIEGARQVLKEVKVVVKRDKEVNQVVEKLETFTDRVRDILLDLSNLKTRF